MKPLLIIQLVGIRSARHFVQRRVLVGVRVRKEGVGGEEEGLLVVEEGLEMVLVDCVELRRRKGRCGRR